jgi:hypothetical protein
MKKNTSLLFFTFILFYGFLQGFLCIAMSTEQCFCEVIIPKHYADCGTDIMTHPLTLVSRSIRKAMLDAKESVIFNCDKNIFGWMEKICSKHLTVQCACDNPHQYPGVLHRKAGGNSSSAYICSPYIRQVAQLYKQTLLYPGVLCVKPLHYMPDYTLPDNVADRKNWQKDYYTGDWDHPMVTPPYFSNSGKNEICVLDSIPVISMHDPTLMKDKKWDYRGAYDVQEFACTYECVLSDDNTSIRRRAYFELEGKQYPFGLLTVMPLLYKKYLQQIRTLACRTRIDDDNAKIFCSTDFFKEYLAETGMETVLSKMFTTMNEGLKAEDKGKLRELSIQSFYQKFFHPAVTDDLLRFALCAKLGGNRMLARALVEEYDVRMRTKLQGASEQRPIYLRPFGGIDGPVCGWGGLGGCKEATGSHYKNFINAITTLENIQSALHEVKKNSRRLILARERVFIEIRPNAIKPLFYLWELKDCYYDCHFCIDWKRGEEFTLSNCPARIIRPLTDMCIDVSAKTILNDEIVILPTVWMPPLAGYCMLLHIKRGISAIIGGLHHRLVKWDLDRT